MKNMWKEYADKYKCSIAEAIKDRDYPADESTIRQWFQEATGRQPTDVELAVMRPDSAKVIADEIAYLNRHG